MVVTPSKQACTSRDTRKWRPLESLTLQRQKSQTQCRFTAAQPHGLPIQQSGCHSIPLPFWAQDHSTKLPHYTSPSAFA